MKLYKDDPKNIRPCDSVRILTPRFVRRVGYDVNFKDVQENVSQEIECALKNRKEGSTLGSALSLVYEELDKLIAKRTGRKTKRTDRDTCNKEQQVLLDAKDLALDDWYERDHIPTEKFAQSLAHLVTWEVVKTNMEKGDQERKVFEYDIPEHKNKTRRVIGVRHHKLGKRFSASGGASVHYGDDYDYESGGLEDCKTIKVLELGGDGLHIDLRIQVTNVEKVCNIIDPTNEWLNKYSKSLSLTQKEDLLLAAYSVEGKLRIMNHFSKEDWLSFMRREEGVDGENRILISVATETVAQDEDLVVAHWKEFTKEQQQKLFWEATDWSNDWLLYIVENEEFRAHAKDALQFRGHLKLNTRARTVLDIVFTEEERLSVKAF